MPFNVNSSMKSDAVRRWKGNFVSETVIQSRDYKNFSFFAYFDSKNTVLQIEIVLITS